MPYGGTIRPNTADGRRPEILVAGCASRAGQNNRSENEVEPETVRSDGQNCSGTSPFARRAQATRLPQSADRWSIGRSEEGFLPCGGGSGDQELSFPRSPPGPPRNSVNNLALPGGETHVPSLLEDVYSVLCRFFC